MDRQKEEKSKADADALKQAESELKQAEADVEGEAEEQVKRERRISYLQGKTPRCEECKKARVTAAEDKLCYACQERVKTAELKAELKKPNPNWYIYWEPYKAFVCRECGSQIAAEENIAGGTLEPAIASCPNTYNCTRGIEYWGRDNAEPQHNLDLYVLDRKK